MSEISRINENINESINMLKKAVTAYIVEHQGSKGYIDTQDEYKDRMYFYQYDYSAFVSNFLNEGRICAIRVVDGNIEILGTTNEVFFDEDAINDAIERAENMDDDDCDDNCEDNWQVIENHYSIDYQKTLMSIGNYIEEYGDDDEGEDDYYGGNDDGGNMNEYEGSISFYIDSSEDGAVDKKDEAVEKLESMDNVDVYNVYDDGEDWCIDCNINVSCDSIKEADKAVTELANEIGVCWDWHYLKGLDTDEYWQP